MAHYPEYGFATAQQLVQVRWCAVVWEALPSEHVMNSGKGGQLAAQSESIHPNDCPILMMS